jgi:hypothetical protein
MVIWSCPECGRECLPTERDCPDCEMIAAHPQLLAPEPSASVMAPAGAVQPLRATPRPTIAPRRATIAAGIASPLDFPFARPALPADLRDFEKRSPGPPARARSRRPLWGVLAATALLCAIAISRNVISTRESRGSAVASHSLAPSATRNDSVYPFAKFIEVTGLRVVIHPNRRSQANYLVVNHSGAELTELDVRVAVRAASSAAPLFTVSAHVPLLGAYEAKEIRSDLDPQLGAADIPDWDRLRADAQVSSRQ